MPEIIMKDQIKKLVDLQKIDAEIYDIKDQLLKKPQMIEKLKEEFESSKQSLNELENKLKDIQVKRKDIELQLKEKEDEIAKANVTLSQLKTNKEYTAKITEIENQKADKSILEEKILVSFDDADEVSKEIESEKGVVADKEKEFQTKKRQVEEDMKVMNDRILVLDGQRKQIVSDIDKSYIDRYERILKNKKGLAIVPVESSACSGCHMNVTPQVINMIKIGGELMTCEMCARIIYLEDEI